MSMKRSCYSGPRLSRTKARARKTNSSATWVAAFFWLAAGLTGASSLLGRFDDSLLRHLRRVKAEHLT